MFDAIRNFGAMTRRVSSRDYQGKTAKVVTLSRSYDTTVEDVWDAVTNGERIPRWFLPISGDLRLGGRYQFQGNAGGTITECEPPHRLVVTWEFGGGVSWVEVGVVADPDGGARLTLQHIAHPEAHWDQYGPGAVGIGWDLGLLGLGLHLTSRASVNPAEGQAWAGSEEGREFIRLSGEDWIKADIAGGADPAVATKTGGRTVAFYTGAPPPADG